VTVTDVSAFRLDVAQSLDFITEKSDTQTAETFDVLIECSGAPGVLATGLRRLRPAGRAAIVGISKEEAIALPLSQINPQELTIYQVNHYAHTWPMAIDLVSSGRIDVKPLVTHHFPLAETGEALALSSHVPDSIKAIIHPQQ
jgi:L-iditol 2-dehydrogenase